MGMFDEVNVYCPDCDELVESYQTKVGPCKLKTYRSNRKMPLALVEQLTDKDFFCVNCCENFYFGYGIEIISMRGERDED